jgi:subtilisin family serine protease
MAFVDYMEPLVHSRRLGLEMGSSRSATATSSQDTSWNIRHVRARAAWLRTKGQKAGGDSVKLLIIDSGSPQSHPDLSADVTDDCGYPPDPYDHVGHGTAVMGVARATDNSIGIVGGGPEVRLYSGKDGEYDAVNVRTICEVQYGIGQDVDVINISEGTDTNSQGEADAINSAYYQHHIVVVAAGARDTNDALTFPANLPSVIAVGEVDTADIAQLDWNGPGEEILAPGKLIYTTFLPTDSYYCLAGGNYYGYCSGTSLASPHVAVGAALAKAYHPSWTPDQIRQLLDTTAKDLGPIGFDATNGWGRLDIGRALGVPIQFTSLLIDGPTCVTSPGSYTYGAEAAGGVPPYGFTWYRNDTPTDTTYDYIGSGQSIDLSLQGGAYSFRLKLAAVTQEFWSDTTITQITVNTGGGPASPIKPYAKSCGN